jgi:hypothetical protein
MNIFMIIIEWLWADKACVLYLGLKWPKPEADHSPTSSAEIKNG